jgi:hypothetical protein
VLAKLNTLKDQLDAMTVKLDATTAKLDALTLKTKDLWETTHYTKGYLQGSIPELLATTHQTCWIAWDARQLTSDILYSNTKPIQTMFPCP